MLKSLGLVLLCFSPSASATDVVANTANRDAELGSAYQSEKQLFVGQSCIIGATSHPGAPTSTFSFDQALTQTQATEELGFGVGGRARFGVVEASASARFMRGAVSNRYSTSAVWVSEYQLPTDKLSTVQKNDIGSAVFDNHERWAETCGDEYVEEITKGAKLLFSIRVDFGSKEQKEQFDAKFKLDGPLYSANADLHTASQHFSQDVKITISALQIGGDVSKLTGLFASSDAGRAGFLQCSLGDFAKCAEVITAALAYATDVTNGFPSQIAPGAKPGPAAVRYKTAKYSAAGIYLSNYPYLDQANAEARSRLHGFFETQLSLLILADRLLDAGMGDKHDVVAKQRSIIDGNISKILAASKTCYEKPLLCAPAVTSLTLANVDESVFVLPPLPIASFRLMTTSKGVWSRDESVAYMRSMIEVYEPLPLFSPRAPVHFSRTPTLSDLGKNEGASVVLYVEGQVLKQADFRFENQLISSIPLSESTASYPGKISGTSAVIVVATTRGNPGWLDINIAAARQGLWTKDMPNADGVFYVLVKDGFGRATRFDIEYEKWKREVSKSGNVVKTEENYSYHNRWWDKKSGGTSVAGDDPYTGQGSSGTTSSTTQ